MSGRADFSVWAWGGSVEPWCSNPLSQRAFMLGSASSSLLMEGRYGSGEFGSLWFALCLVEFSP